MEARDNESQVRPIPITDDNGVLLPDAGAPRRERATPPHRPRLPLAVSLIAVVGLVTAVAVFGAVEFRDTPSTDPEVFSITAPEDEASSTVDTVPLSLEEAVPGITDRLTLITTDGEALWTLVWDPSYRVPKTYAMMSPSAQSWTSASFDAGGRVIAALGTGLNGTGPQDLWFGQPTQIDHIRDIDEVWSTTWHASELSRLAFMTFTVGDASEATLQLQTTEIDALTDTHTSPRVMSEFTELASVVRWDNSGFVIQMGDTTLALDAGGAELWRNDGWAQNASPNFIPQIRTIGEGSQWYLTDRSTGDHTSFAEFGINASAIETTVVGAQSNDLFAAATYREAGTTVTVIAPKLGAQLSAPRVVQVKGDPALYQFTPSASFLILRPTTTNDLIFLDWRTGAVHHFDVPDNQTVLALNLG